MTEAAIRERAERAIKERVFPGCVVGAVHLDGRRLVVPCGTFTYEADSPPVTAETVYDLASVTKSVVTASLASILIEEGKLRLSDPVAMYVPQLKNDHGATIEDLLRYRLKGLRLSTIAGTTFEEVRSSVLEHGFEGPPGEAEYTNLPALILGLVIEEVAGESLAALAERELFKPLGMQATGYFPAAEDCAPTEIDFRDSDSAKASTGKEVRGLPHDESAYKFALARQSAGHAGLFSTVPDLLNFLHALLNSVDVGHPMSYISESAAEGLGWQTDGDFLGHHASPGSFGKTGFTGTSIAVDVQKEIAFVILSNRTYPHRPADMDAINEFRRDIADIILGRG
jgi:CubicO group peptidase (beta-lactamase class C family)